MKVSSLVVSLLLLLLLLSSLVVVINGTGADKNQEHDCRRMLDATGNVMYDDKGNERILCEGDGG